LRSFPVGDGDDFQCCPSVVKTMSPKGPTATHEVVLAQLMPEMDESATLACAVKVCPPSVVLQRFPPPAKQTEELGQLIASKVSKKGSTNRCSVVPPSVVTATALPWAMKQFSVVGQLMALPPEEFFTIQEPPPEDV